MGIFDFSAWPNIRDSGNGLIALHPSHGTTGGWAGVDDLFLALPNRCVAIPDPFWTVRRT